MPEITPTRRTVLRTAAWSVPAVTVATAAPAFAASSPEDPEVQYQEVNETFIFNPVVLGTVNTDPANEVVVNVVATVPLQIPRGMTAAPVQTQSTVTIPASLAGLLGGLILGNPAEFDGTSVSTTALTGAITAESITNLTIARTPWPASGNPLNVVASGSGAEGLFVPAGAPTGPVTMTLQPPASTLQGYTAAGDPSAGAYQSQLSPRPGDDYTLGIFNIV